MHQRHFLLLAVVTFVALTSDVTYAKKAVQATNIETASDPVILNDANNLKRNAAIIDATASASEERGFKLPSFLTKFFQRSPKANNVVKISPDVAKTLKDPKVRQTIKELEGKKGLAEHLKSLPGIRNIAERLKSKSGPLTSTIAKELGAVAMKSSGKWKTALLELGVPFGIAFLIVLGLYSLAVAFDPFPDQ